MVTGKDGYCRKGDAVVDFFSAPKAEAQVGNGQFSCLLRICFLLIVITFSETVQAVTVYGFGERVCHYECGENMTLRTIVGDILQKEINLSYLPGCRIVPAT